ncbi:hypothetical protein WJX72_011395 [[Myrmecia] bisecta]|uniref:VLRF1 domain-containing protein n=1 Tax=[Myrmecia] bisecta TaxID=41462 RepID=A0AAW1PQS7_9CHLO
MSLLGHLFTLPDSLFAGAVPTSSLNNSGEAQQDIDSQAVPQPLARAEQPEEAGSVPAARQQEAPSGPTCVTCGVGVTSPAFGTTAEQRAHFRTDWHRLNVKRRVAGHPAVSEEEFERIIDDQDEVASISGSDASSSDEEEAAPRRAQPSQRTSQIVFTNAGGKHFAVWRPLLLPDSSKAPPTDVDAGQQLAGLRSSPGTWAVILSRGGHFVAAIFALKPAQPKQQSKEQPLLFEVVAHKTFHRYVVRAKAGGRQSTKDASGKYARSAGSRLRRYNEAALEKDIQETLHSWQAQLDAAALLFVHAPSANATAIFGGAAPALSKADPRLRTIPFTTRRPTFSEAQRVVRTLLCVFEASALALQTASQSPAKPAPKVKPAAASKPPSGPSSAQAAATLAAEQAAAAAAAKACADPAVLDARGRPPYDVASEKSVRDAFRRFMACEPAKWDYAAAAVPSPLSEELEAQQQAKQAEKKARQKEKERERKAAAAERKKAAAAEAKAAAEEEVRQAAAQAAAILAKQKARVSRKDKAPAVSKSEAELRKKREQMAAAAEARMAKLQLAAQQQQLW